MGELNSLGLTTRYYYDHSSIPNAADVKERYEAETKERALPFAIVRFALANLPQSAGLSSFALGERMSRLLTGISSDNSRVEDLPIIEALKNQNDPELQQSMEKLIDLYRRINSKINKMELERKNLFLADLAKDFFVAGDYDKALDLINTMGHCGDHKNESLCEFAKIMIKMGNFGKAFEYTKIISDDVEKDILISILVGSLLKSHHLEDAIKFLDIVTDRKLKKHLFRKIASCFFPETKIELLVDLINKMSYEERDCYTLELVSKNINLENLEKYLPLLNTLTKTSSKALAFWNISMILKKSGNLPRATIFFEKARELFNDALPQIEQDFTEAKRITDPTVRDEYLRILTSTLYFLIASPNIVETVVVTLEDGTPYRNNISTNVVEENVRAGHFDKILEIIQEMTVKSRDAYIKKRIGDFLNLNLIPEATKLWKLINNFQERSILWLEIERVTNKKNVEGHASELVNAEPTKKNIEGHPSKLVNAEPSDKKDFLAFKSIDDVIEKNFEEAIKISYEMVDKAVKGLSLLKISNYLKTHNPDRAWLILDQAQAAFTVNYQCMPQKIADAYKIEDVVERDQVLEIIILSLLFDITSENLAEVDRVVEQVQDPTLKNRLKQKIDDMVEANDRSVELNELDRMLFS